MIDALPAGEALSLYRQGGFTDLCRGPHIPTTSRVAAFKLLSVAGAYWRGDEHNRMLSRIYGTAFFDKKELKQHLNFLEEAKKRDHRKLGRELDLFSFHEDIGAGLVVWHPNGMVLRNIIEEFERREHRRRGYLQVSGPQLLKRELWETSGHFDHYRENMYFTAIDDVAYGIKPMNCLAHMLIYKSKMRSYRDLPLRYFEMGLVHRHEKSGGAARADPGAGLHPGTTPTSSALRSRWARKSWGVMDFITYTMNIFGFDYKLELSTRPEKSIGSDEGLGKEPPRPSPTPWRPAAGNTR